MKRFNYLRCLTVIAFRSGILEALRHHDYSKAQAQAQAEVK